MTTKTKNKSKSRKKTGRRPQKNASLKNGKLEVDLAPPVSQIVADRLNAGKKLTAQEIATELKVSYAAVWQVLKKWHKEGKIQRELVEKSTGPVTFCYFLK